MFVAMGYSMLPSDEDRQPFLHHHLDHCSSDPLLLIKFLTVLLATGEVTLR